MATYNRGEMIERRQAVMTQWPDFLDGKVSAKVVPITQGRKRQ